MNRVGPLQAQNNLSEIAAGGSAAQAAAQANLGLGSVSQSAVNLKGPTSTAALDAQISVPDGGSEDYQGTLQLQAACVQVLGYDGALLARVMAKPGATDVVCLEAGEGNTGATIYAYSPGYANSSVNLVSQGVAPINISSGAGLLGQFISPTVPVTNPITFTPGSGSNYDGRALTYATITVTTPGNMTSGLLGLYSQGGPGAAFGPDGPGAPSIAAYSSYCFGAGYGISLGGTGCIALGRTVNASTEYNITLGYYGRDQGRRRTLTWCNGYISGPATMQRYITLLIGSVTGAGSFRCTSNNSAADATNTANLVSQNHGTAYIGVHLVNISALVQVSGTNDFAVLTISNLAVANDGSGNISIQRGSPLAMTLGDYTAGGASISGTVSLDSTNAGLNVTINQSTSSANVTTAVVSIDAIENSGR